jgi:hypothetical protein
MIHPFDRDLNPEIYALFVTLGDLEIACLHRLFGCLMAASSS